MLLVATDRGYTVSLYFQITIRSEVVCIIVAMKRSTPIRILLENQVPFWITLAVNCSRPEEQRRSRHTDSTASHVVKQQTSAQSSTF